MDSMEVNKGIAAVLVAGIAFFLTGMIGDILVREQLPEKPVLNIAAAPGPSAGGGAAKQEPLPPIATLLQSADPAAGEATREEGLRRLSHLQQGWQGGRRTQPVWRDRGAPRSYGGLRLLQRAQGQAGRLELR